MRPKGDSRCRVPFFDPRTHYRRLKSRLDAAFFDCMEKGDLIHREQLAAFERHFAEWIGTAHAIGVNSGYDALFLAMRAAGIGPGDEVICPGHTFVACVSAIVNLGATPVLVDIGPDQNMDVRLAEAAVTNRTRAIMPVHLNGRMCDMEAVMDLAARFELVVVEDVAQATGAAFRGRKAGAFGIGCFSFYPFKMLGCFGDGGAVTTDDADLARTVRRLRFNGEDPETGEYHDHGYTALLDNVQAALLDVKLPYLEGWIEDRRRIAARYREGLAGVGDLVLPPEPAEGYRDVWQNFVVRTARRDELRRHLYERGIETLVMWKKPLWHHPGLRLGSPRLPECERLYREMLYLPIHPELEDDQVEWVIEEVSSFFAAPAVRRGPSAPSLRGAEAGGRGNA